MADGRRSKSGSRVRRRSEVSIQFASFLKKILKGPGGVELLHGPIVWRHGHRSGSAAYRHTSRPQKRSRNSAEHNCLSANGSARYQWPLFLILTANTNFSSKSRIKSSWSTTAVRWADSLATWFAAEVEKKKLTLIRWTGRKKVRETTCAVSDSSRTGR